MGAPIPDLAAVKAEVDNIIEKLSKQLQKVNRKIFENPEIAWQEKTAHDSICDLLEGLGFVVTRHAYGLDTAFEASSGTSGRTVSFNAEYDALPSIGHACGHNLIATAGLTGFLALSLAIKKFGLEYQTQLLGTPAEEADGGKIKLIDAGAYKGDSVSLMAHPMNTTGHGDPKNTGSAGSRSIAHLGLIAEYHGKNAHAGTNPWDGINALDAAVAAYNNISMLRQQIRPTDRIHGCFLDGPKVTNVIPDYTKLGFSVRSPTMADTIKLGERVKACFQAAGVATGCEVTITEEPLYADLLPNDTLCGRYQSHMSNYGVSVCKVRKELMFGSTDQGNVSYELPALHAEFGIPTAEGSGPHTIGFTKAAGKPESFDCAIIVGKAMALTGWEVLTDSKLYENVRKDYEESIATYA